MQHLNQQKASQKVILPPLSPGNQVQIASKIFNNAIIVKRHVSPSSYNVQSGRHNRRHLHRSTEAANITDHCSDLIVDESTPHPNNSMLSSVTELGDWPSSLQPASPTISSAGISQPDKLHTTRSGWPVRCPQRVTNSHAHKYVYSALQF